MVLAAVAVRLLREAQELLASAATAAMEPHLAFLVRL
jgi:hypothetical protein